MFSIPQIRSLQGALTALGTTRVSQANPVYQTLQDTLQATGREAVSSRIVPVLYPSAPRLRGLLFRFKDEAEHTVRLVLPDNREAPSALHLELPKSEQRPTLLELSYIHTTRRRAVTANYLLLGGLEAFPDSDFEYSRRDRKTRFLAQLAEVLHRLNTPVSNLPYPQGRKLAITGALGKLGIRYVGELIRHDEATLRAALGDTGWITVRSILKNLRLSVGSPIPQWRRPAA